MIQAFAPQAPSTNGNSQQRFQQLKMEMHRRLVEMLDISKLDNIKRDRLRREVKALATRMADSSSEKFSDAERERLVDEIMAESFGLGPLDPLMSDPTISDVLVNGPNEVWVERGGRLVQTNVVFADNHHLIEVIQRISAQVGRRVDESSPLVDARLQDGSRVNAIIPPLALDGPVLSIRRFGVRLAAEDLLANATLAPDMLAYLRAAVEARLNTVVCGGAGAGKTTLLNALSRYIPDDERLVTIEDSAELRLQQKHVVRLETRLPNMEGAGEYTQRDLVRNSLRMRPDRIIIGECRGPEALDMLQAMNTGHDGSLTTVHANDTRDALARLEMMVTMAGFLVPLSVVRGYIASAVQLVIHLARLKGGARRITRISEISRGKEGRGYRVRDLFVFKQAGVRDGQAVGSFHATGKIPRALQRIHLAGIDLPEEMFKARELPLAR